MFKVIVVICVLSTPKPACQVAGEHLAVLYPETEVAGSAQCMQFGMFYAAESGLVQPGTYPKIFCKPIARGAHA